MKSKLDFTFIPDWSSLGAGPADALGVADGLFNWNAWPWGDEDSTTYVDASYRQVSPKVLRDYLQPDSGKRTALEISGSMLSCLKSISLLTRSLNFLEF